MTGQHDRQDEKLTGQLANQSGHCPLTGRYFEPCAPSLFLCYISRAVSKGLLIRQLRNIKLLDSPLLPFSSRTETAVKKDFN